LSAARAGTGPRVLEVLASPKMLAILLLAAASGFPNQITESALQAWLKDVGASNTTIGIMSYVALPYLLKFLWAPFIDRYPLPLLGRRRGWIFVMQLALAAAIALLAFQNPAASLGAVSVCAAAIVFFSATQDISIDAYRTDVALPSERGLAAAAANLGYRIASYVALAVALIVADLFGWRPAFLILAAAMLLFCVATVLAPSSHNSYQPRSMRESVIEPLRELLSTPSALTLIAVVLLFKIGDAFANKLFTPFMMDVGFSKTEIGIIIKAAIRLHWQDNTFPFDAPYSGPAIPLGPVRLNPSYLVVVACLAVLVAALVAFSGQDFPLALVGESFANGVAVWVGGIVFALVIYALYRRMGRALVG